MSMQNAHSILAVLLLCAASLRAQEFQVSERSHQHNLWERRVQDVGPNGQAIERTESFTELATGLNYLDERNHVVQN